MHKCVRCGRLAVSLEEIDAGCPCGSKVFIFGKESAPGQAAPPQAEGAPSGQDVAASSAQATAPSPDATLAQNKAAASEPTGTSIAPSTQPQAEASAPEIAANASPSQVQGEKTVVMEPVEPDGKVPSSYYARASFTTEDVENIKVLTEGVFLIDVRSLSRDPMVLKDQEGVYYVKLPFCQRKDGAQGGNGKKEG